MIIMNSFIICCLFLHNWLHKLQMFLQKANKRSYVAVANTWLDGQRMSVVTTAGT